MDKSCQKTVPLSVHGVDYKLYNMATTPQVFWSSESNSFVLVHDSEFVSGKRSASWLHPFLGRVALFSINGEGEIRWDVAPMRKKNYQSIEDREAIEHFDLVPIKGRAEW